MKKGGGVPPGTNPLTIAEYDRRYQEGDRTMLVEPLDWKILEMMPDAGTNVGGLYQIGSSSADIAKRLGVQKLTAQYVAMRIRTLESIGLCQSVRTLGRSRTIVWQKSPFGKEELTRWQATQPS